MSIIVEKWVMKGCLANRLCFWDVFFQSLMWYLSSGFCSNMEKDEITLIITLSYKFSLLVWQYDITGIFVVQ